MERISSVVGSFRERHARQVLLLVATAVSEIAGTLSVELDAPFDIYVSKTSCFYSQQTPFISLPFHADVIGIH